MERRKPSSEKGSAGICVLYRRIIGGNCGMYSAKGNVRPDKEWFGG